MCSSLNAITKNILQRLKEEKTEIKRGSYLNTFFICRGISARGIRLEFDDGPHAFIILIFLVFSCLSLCNDIICIHPVQVLRCHKGFYRSVDSTFPWRGIGVNRNPPARTCLLLISPLLGSSAIFLYLLNSHALNYQDYMSLPSTFGLAISAKTWRQS